MLDWKPFDSDTWAAFCGANHFRNGDNPHYAHLKVDGLEAIALSSPDDDGKPLLQVHLVPEVHHLRHDEIWDLYNGVCCMNAIIRLQPDTTTEELYRLGFVQAN